jgi:hypothetical protein
MLKEAEGAKGLPGTDPHDDEARMEENAAVSGVSKG